MLTTQSSRISANRGRGATRTLLLDGGGVSGSAGRAKAELLIPGEQLLELPLSRDRPTKPSPTSQKPRYRQPDSCKALLTACKIFDFCAEASVHRS